MFKTVEDFQKLSRTQLEAATQSAAALTRGFQQLALEASDYSKKSIEESSAAFGKLIGVKGIDDVIAVQTEYAKASYDSALAEMTKVGELVAAMTKDAYKPFETAFEQVVPR